MAALRPLAIALLRTSPSAVSGKEANRFIDVALQVSGCGLALVETYAVDGGALRDDLVRQAITARLQRGDVHVLVVTDDVPVLLLRSIQRACRISIREVPALPLAS